MRKAEPKTIQALSGGTSRAVNTWIPGLDAALRPEPRKSSGQISHLRNNTWVSTVSDTPVFDAESGRHYVQVTVNGMIGWIASSIVGLPR